MADLKLLATCNGGSCPTIYRDGDDVIVQGYTHQLDTPDGEQAVRLPRWLLYMAVAADDDATDEEGAA